MSLFTGCVANGALCGPFLISKGFWIDAGRCVLDGDDPDSDEGNLRVHHIISTYCQMLKLVSNIG